MHDALIRRVERLEQEANPARRMWVIEGPAGMKTGDAIRHVGINPARNDLVIFGRLFSDPRPPPRLVSVQTIKS